MQSLTTPPLIPISNHGVSRLNASLIPALFFACKSEKRDKICQKRLFLGVGLTEERRAYKFGRNLDNSWCCRCQKSDGDVDLEAEIMDFMAKSEKPSMFPTKEELVRAGRLDLVKCIKKKGGWYSFGWDNENVEDDVEETIDSDIAEFQRRIQSCKQSGSPSLSEGVLSSTSQNPDSLQLPGPYSLDTSLQLAADEDSGELTADEDSGAHAADEDSGAHAADEDSEELAADEDPGIGGILSRLKKQRNNELMEIKLGKDKYEAHSRSKHVGDGAHYDTSLGRSDLEANSRLTSAYHHKGALDSSDRNTKHYTEPETWRSWSSKRAGFPLTEFEEISYGKESVDDDKESSNDGITVTTKEHGEDSDKHEEINYNEIRSHLRYLESELRTTLQSVRSKGVNSISEEVTGSSSELDNLSDALEFQENEVISSKEKLRSLRAKLAILQGKMTLATIKAKRVVEVKHRQIDVARKSLQHLRSTSIVWHNSAAEVLLTGSFDGWTTQRRMQKLKSGVFSITLKLYPGIYEIKFIVDGQWKVDPLRPIVYNNGFQNNLFTVT